MLIMSAALSDTDLLEKITRERGLTGDDIVGLFGVVQQGIRLQMQR